MEVNQHSQYHDALHHGSCLGQEGHESMTYSVITRIPSFSTRILVVHKVNKHTAIYKCTIQRSRSQRRG